MDEKLKKISLKLSKRYKKHILQEIYTSLMKDVMNNWDYFNKFYPVDYVKMTIYIFSLFETGKFELGEKMIQNSYVGNYFEFGEGDFALETCENCGGDGYVNCDTCDGNGKEECDDCSGSGNISCESCDGSGEDDEGDSCDECRGNGEVKCDRCDGEGTFTCNNCGGDSQEECFDCRGKGEIESDKLVYYNTTFVTWDDKLINMFRNSNELAKPTSIQDFLPLYNQEKMLELITEQQQDEFAPTVSPDKIYCFGINPLESTDLFVERKPQGLTTGETPNYYQL
jgi:hypothetical protein